MGSLKSVPEEFFGKGLEKLFDISNFTAMTYEEQMEYLAKFHAELDRAAELEAAIDKGNKLGLTVGLEQGRKQGRKEGREEGRKEKAIEAATKFKAAGVSLDIISQCTGVPMDILENL